MLDERVSESRVTRKFKCETQSGASEAENVYIFTGNHYTLTHVMRQTNAKTGNATLISRKTLAQRVGDCGETGKKVPAKATIRRN
jgi:hypothetical protein